MWNLTKNMYVFIMNSNLQYINMLEIRIRNMYLFEIPFRMCHVHFDICRTEFHIF